MIDIDKLSLPVCALGATAAHVVVLGLVLPMSVVLPRAGESMTPKRVAISVEILEEAPVAPPMAQPQIFPAQPEIAQPQVATPQVSSVQPVLSAQPLEAEPPETKPDTVNALLQNVSVTTVTTNAPEPENLPSDTSDITGSLPEAVSEVVPAETVPTEVVADEIASDEVAEVDEVMPPLPTRVRRDAQGTAIIAVHRAAPKPVRRTARAVSRRLATPKRAAGPFQGAFGSLFGKPANNRTR